MEFPEEVEDAMSTDVGDDAEQVDSGEDTECANDDDPVEEANDDDDDDEEKSEEEEEEVNEDEVDEEDEELFSPRRKAAKLGDNSGQLPRFLQDENRARKEKKPKIRRKKPRKAPQKGGRKHIRNVMQSAELNAETLKALRDEEERIRRLQQHEGADQFLSVDESVKQCAVSATATVQSSHSPANIERFEGDAEREMSNKRGEEKIVFFVSDDEDGREERSNSQQENLGAKRSAKYLNDPSRDLELSDGGGHSSEGDDVVCISDQTSNAVHSEDYEGETDAEYEEATFAQTTAASTEENSCNSRILINVAHPKEDPDVLLSLSISNVIKPHQIQGIRFLYSNIVENFSRFEKTPGFGCILGHSMGLGKTLQLVAFTQLLLEYKICKRVLVIVPINTVQNWVNEFSSWTSCDIFDLAKSRAEEMRKTTEAARAMHEAELIRSYEEVANFVAFTPPIVDDEIIEELSNMCSEFQDLEFDFSKLYDVPSNQVAEQLKKLYTDPLALKTEIMEDISMGSFFDESFSNQDAATECSLSVQDSSIFEDSSASQRLVEDQNFNDASANFCNIDVKDPTLHAITEQSIKDEETCQERHNEGGVKTEVSDVSENDKSDSPPPRLFTVFKISDDCKNNRDRIELVDKWYQTGGALLMGYEMFRLLSSKLSPSALRSKSSRSNVNSKNRKVVGKMMEEDRLNEGLIQKLHSQLLTPGGPDVVIADEGHRIKNSDSAIAKCLKAIRTRRRIVLTGYPLQNNLTEYWCMVDFVRPNYLGTKVEFSNMFERPISNGQCADSTAQDIKLMKYRSHVLTSLLRGFVLRRSHSVLIKALPRKTEFIVLIRMSPIQKELYKSYLNYISSSGSSDVLSTTLDPESFNVIDQVPVLPGEACANPIRAFGALCKVWNHPDVLHHCMQQQKQQLAMNGQLPNAPAIDYSWAASIMSQYKSGNINDGPKMLILLEIIRLSVQKREKVLVFSQSLGTLSLIEECLAKSTVPNSSQIWRRNVHYFRLDGETSATDRGFMINKFNERVPEATTDGGECCWLFLLSTKAGCLGINLVSANRVVIMDVCWNPCHDAQAVCRVFRYGQTKPTFIYRLVANNTMEKRMYDRQVSKQGMSQRIVDELNPQLVLTRNEVEKLLDFGEETADIVDHTVSLNKYNDDVLQEICSLYYPMIATSPFEHESLLVDNESKLSLAEKREAKEGYQRDKQREMGAASSQSLSNLAGNYPPASPLVHNSSLSTLNDLTRHLQSTKQYQQSSVKSSLLNLLSKNKNMSQTRQKPVANIRPFSVRARSSNSYPAHLPFSSTPSQSAAWMGDSNQSLTSRSNFTLSGDVRIPGNRTYSGQDMVLHAGEQVSLSKVVNPLTNAQSFFLRTANGSVFQMDDATAASLISVCGSPSQPMSNFLAEPFNQFQPSFSSFLQPSQSFTPYLSANRKPLSNPSTSAGSNANSVGPTVIELSDSD